ncbi:sigma-70 family RNA polymerase sigma factor [Myxococcus llanfairpwllgwyngyllgogerychwyrndrobwllllantysiliogogogochensis]|uniref:Sigma-70 family RNA polymerase sigma factor n=1 Tax=Myxococcus llanfairpwllgwyngyllgogerychwyrndrobwllllantysiliogogogochensis TaxID=2590453 RepID=A0A540X5E5_9BACT|nr:sigma-70 family RNA polymerase sigma factor [Myxococcus llanfairpwllgwyngyllgogerychwyrndrobwllllantysiliogogogochensis]TQF16478.1 sigma-70 family RNA polymerase sigma factor [Myxococcus llanfairpwllgwyngyllgogerychwyrndrobwllllantysiliogogogochensis]
MSKQHSRSHLFVQHLPPAARRCAEVPGLETLLESWVSTGRHAWPDVVLPEEDFLRHVAQRLVPGQEPADTLAAVPVSDLYLACACARGLPAAHAALERHFFPKVASAISRVRGGGVDAKEVLQQLRQRLLVPAQDGAEPRIAEYQGGGPLAAWLRAAAVRMALNLQRAEGRRARAEEDGDGTMFERVGEAGRDIELDYLRRRHQQDFRDALSGALATLSARERTVLRLHVVDGVSLESIGVMYRAHKSTVSRWMSQARQTVLVGVRERLAERLQLSSGELHSLMHAVRSQLDMSLSGLLRGEPGPG